MYRKVVTFSSISMCGKGIVILHIIKGIPIPIPYNKTVLKDIIILHIKLIQLKESHCNRTTIL
jgi:hypothetical protein